MRHLPHRTAIASGVFAMNFPVWVGMYVMLKEGVAQLAGKQITQAH